MVLLTPYYQTHFIDLDIWQGQYSFIIWRSWQFCSQADETWSFTSGILQKLCTGVTSHDGQHSTFNIAHLTWIARLTWTDGVLVVNRQIPGQPQCIHFLMHQCVTPNFRSDNTFPPYILWFVGGFLTDMQLDCETEPHNFSWMVIIHWIRRAIEWMTSTWTDGVLVMNRSRRYPANHSVYAFSCINVWLPTSDQTRSSHHRCHAMFVIICIMDVPELLHRDTDNKDRGMLALY